MPNMNVEKEMTLLEALQSITRMRKIWQNQRVDFPLKDDVASDVVLQIFDGLMQNPQFKKVLSKESSFAPQLIDELDLEPPLQMALKQTLAEIGKNQSVIDRYRAAKMSPKEFQLAFLDCFIKHFKIDSDTLWRYFVANLANAKLDKHWEAGQHRMREVVESPIRKVLTDTTIALNDRKKLFEKFQDLVVTTEVDSPFTDMAMTTEILDGNEAIEKRASHYLGFWNRLNQLSPQMVQKVQSHAYGAQPVEEIVRGCIDEARIHEGIELSQDVLGQELEQETEREKEAQRQLEVQHETGLPLHKYYDQLVNSNNEFFEKRFLPISKVLPKDVKVHHEENLFYSPNLFIDSAQLGSKDHGTYHLKANCLLLIQEPNKPKRYLLVSNSDAAFIRKGLPTHTIRAPRLLALCTFDGQVIAASDINEAKKATKDPLFSQIAVQAKALTGNANFTMNDVKLLKTCLKEPQNAKAWQKMYENIIKYKPSCAKRYIGSYLERMFSTI